MVPFLFRYIGKREQTVISIFPHRRHISDEEFDTLFRSSYQSLYCHAYSFLNDAEECRDVLSEVFISLLEGRPRKDCLSTGYLMAMVHNRCMDILRHRKVEDEARRQMVYDYQLFMDADENREERLAGILQFVETELTPQTRRILRMCYDQKKTYREVALELGISVQAVNKHISQALRKMREHFNPNKDYGKRQ